MMGFNQKVFITVGSIANDRKVMPSFSEAGDQRAAEKIKNVHLEETTLRIDDSTPIVRYMKLEALLLMLKGWVFIPSHATLGRSDRLETNILRKLPDRWGFWDEWANKIGPRIEHFLHARQQRDFNSPMSTIARVWGDDLEFVRENFYNYVDELAAERCVWCWNVFQNRKYSKRSGNFTAIAEWSIPMPLMKRNSRRRAKAEIKIRRQSGKSW